MTPIKEVREMGDKPMTLEEACHSILGDRLAHSIISDMGVHWAVVAATAQARNSDNPAALAAIRKHLAEQKALSSTEGKSD